ncbi:NADH-quinone oxidoreductase subunit NuoE [Actinomyces sp. B33]|uniref:NADH-quinone oxidoreductase subunit NuoE n=1 Tax=Actinomyces sp. B33 TaxID=2942131 RepID=UPI0023411904|nr:NADH-quinone oxidoreductase subunit NuoE [Actinomyces sp. B33]MDC4233547.1 NADH-quinone oxidoreductase subunit NuoE [Actinomyces sp. B33]
MTYPADVEARLRADSAEIISRYPTGHARSAMLPMLHLVQSVDGYVSPDGIALIADVLDLPRAEISAVATFYTQYKRHPTGDYLVGVCTNALCAVMGGDDIWEAVSERVGVGSDETSESGRITLERIECNAACDYAPVVMVNWEFFDNQTPESALALVDDIEAGRPVHPTRGPDVAPTFKENERTLAGFLDGHEHEGPSAGAPTVLGRRIADERGWTEPVAVAGSENETNGGDQA